MATVAHPYPAPHPVLDLAKLTPKDGDVIVARLPAGVDPEKCAMQLREALAKIGAPKTIVITAAPGTDIYLPSDEEMEKHGWTRAKPIKFREFL